MEMDMVIVIFVIMVIVVWYQNKVEWELQNKELIFFLIGINGKELKERAGGYFLTLNT